MALHGDGPVLQSVAQRVSRDGERRMYSQPFLNIATAVVAAVFAVAGTAGVSNAGSPSATRLVAAAALIAALLVAIRCSRMAVVVSSEGVTFRSLLRTRTFAVGSIESFDVAKPYGSLSHNGIRVNLNGGRSISTGLFATSPVYSAGGARQTAELNDWLEATRLGRQTTFVVRPRSWGSKTAVRLAFATAILVWTVFLVIMIELIADPSALLSSR